MAQVTHVIFVWEREGGRRVYTPLEWKNTTAIVRRNQIDSKRDR
jgi:hypothetical protein